MTNQSQLVEQTPLSVAIAKGIRVVDEPVQASYRISRIPDDASDPSQLSGISVSADSVAGRQWGCSQVLQEQAAGLEVTIGEFEPPLQTRMLHVDAARHYFSYEHLASLLRLMAWCRLNVMNLHISENLGYRLESKIYPDITSDDHLTWEDIARLRELAAQCGVKIVPSIDMPGHLEHVLQTNRWAQLFDGDKPIYSALDILNPDAVNFVWAILDEVIEVFDTDEVTIGGDEFLEVGTQVPVLRQAAKRFGQDAQEHDIWIDFVNQTVQRLAARGIKAGVFNDGIHHLRVVDLDQAAKVHYWTRWGAHMAYPTEFSSHQIFNWNANSCYFVLRRDQLDLLPNFDSVWENFDPWLFPDRVSNTYISDVAGACFSIWCDEPDALSSTSIVRMVKEPLLAFSHRCWQLGCLRNKEVIRKCGSLLN